MAAVATGGVADGQRLRHAAVCGDSHDFAFLIEDEGFTVATPVRRFGTPLHRPHDDRAAKVVIVADGLERAEEREVCGQRRRLLDGDMGEDGFLRFGGIVRAEAEADIERLFEMHLGAGADLVERLRTAVERHGLELHAGAAVVETRLVDVHAAPARRVVHFDARRDLLPGLAVMDDDVAREIASEEIDILVDLNGFTKGARTDIFAYRPAPIQVNFLGYPGTMGAPFVDYIISDSTVLTAADQANYSEKIIRLPHSYQPNDLKRAIATNPYERADFNLPSDHFIYCCFNNSYKIQPAVFDTWMRILRANKASSLWLLIENQSAIHNLKTAAEANGVDSARLIFASRIEPAEHLARHRLADLFLDTSPYNAHTTASDALWSGLPILTQIGETFAGRVSASLLYAIGIPELVVKTAADYETLAIELAQNFEKLSIIRDKLTLNRLSTPLFNSGLFARTIESAYQTIYARKQKGLSPKEICFTPN